MAEGRQTGGACSCQAGTLVQKTAGLCTGTGALAIGAEAGEADAWDGETAAEVGARSGVTVARCRDPAPPSGGNAASCDDHALACHDNWFRGHVDDP